MLIARQSVPKRERISSHVIMMYSLGHGVQNDLDSAMYKTFALTDPPPSP